MITLLIFVLNVSLQSEKVVFTSNSLRALSHSFWPGACWVHSMISWLMLSVTALKQRNAQKCLVMRYDLICFSVYVNTKHVWYTFACLYVQDSK